MRAGLVVEDGIERLVAAHAWIVTRGRVVVAIGIVVEEGGEIGSLPGGHVPHRRPVDEGGRHGVAPWEFGLHIAIGIVQAIEIRLVLLHVGP